MKRDPSKRALPRYAIVFFCVTGLSLILWLIAIPCTRFADWFHRVIGGVLRTVLGVMTSPLPFSLAEMLLYLLPILLIVLVWRKTRRTLSRQEILRLLASICSVAGLLFSLFTVSFGIGHRTTPLPQKMGIEVRTITASELKNTAVYLIQQINSTVDGVRFGEDGFSGMPYSLREMNDRLLRAFDDVSARHSFLQNFPTQVKPILASEPMTYTHISGVYSFFTGEANINTNFPDYTLPFTAAHELAHQRGIAREEEANFVAFLVGETSEDPYIRYCAYLNLFEYVSGALYRASPQDYRAVLETLDARVRGEMRAYRAFFEKYADSAAAKVSDAVNDGYLKLHGNEAGSASYGLVVDLAVAYLEKTVFGA